MNEESKAALAVIKDLTKKRDKYSKLIGDLMCEYAWDYPPAPSSIQKPPPTVKELRDVSNETWSRAIRILAPSTAFNAQQMTLLLQQNGKPEVSKKTVYIVLSALYKKKKLTRVAKGTYKRRGR